MSVTPGPEHLSNYHRSTLHRRFQHSVAVVDLRRLSKAGYRLEAGQDGSTSDDRHGR